MTGTTVSRLEVAPPELSRLRPQLVARPGDGQHDTPPTPLPGTDIMNADKKTHAGFSRLLRAFGPSSGPLTSKSPTSTSTSLSKTRGLVGRLHDRRSGCQGDKRHDDSVFAHCLGARRIAVATTSATTRHRRLERLQSVVHRQLPVYLLQAGAAMGPLIHQAPGDETLRSYLKRFQTMRNCIPKVAEAVVIEDLYRVSNDSAFVQAILQKASATSEQLFREADLYITVDERAQDLIGGTKPAPPTPRRDVNQQPDRRWEKRPREEVHAVGPPIARARGAPRGGEQTLDDIFDAQCLYHKDMCHTLRNCRDFKHSVRHAQPFHPLPPPPPQRGPGEPRQPQ
jgi:hypothetical protein